MADNSLGIGTKIHEPEIQRLACSDALKRGIATYAMALQENLGDSLLGIYIYGSLARGCYHPSTGDVDVIVAIKDFYTRHDDSLVLKPHHAVGAPVDGVFVTESQIAMDIVPTPIAFTVKPISGYSIVPKPEGSRDFLLQRQEAYEAGITVAGRLACDAIPPVPWPLLEESLDFLLPYIVHYFKNPILMLSRIAYAHTFHKLSSKQAAGEWAATTFGEDWCTVIRSALDKYATGSSVIDASRAVREEYQNYCLNYINSIRPYYLTSAR